MQILAIAALGVASGAIQDLAVKPKAGPKAERPSPKSFNGGSNGRIGVGIHWLPMFAIAGGRMNSLHFRDTTVVGT
jgi:hypothetical protein